MEFPPKSLLTFEKLANNIAYSIHFYTLEFELTTKQKRRKKLAIYAMQRREWLDEDVGGEAAQIMQDKLATYFVCK